jgi:hypothetical protein
MEFGPDMSQATSFGPTITFLIICMILFLILKLLFDDLAVLREARTSAPAQMRDLGGDWISSVTLGLLS